ncbi:GTP-binding nuclear protein spi1 [Cladobotryum mycophilum]|uniref:GTP-binding nuclear protein spi1 n=1 Tax=Cladobotryum mycophilum TaxID=491253 RepID=A0ABR0SQN5_9HYPO
MADSSKKTFKLILVGDGKVGKTALCSRHIGVAREVKDEYVPTNGIEIVPLKFSTNEGEVCFDVWDVAGGEKKTVLRDISYVGGQCAIIMFDVTSRPSFENVSQWYREIVDIVGESIPIVLCGNKVDLKHHAVQAKHIASHDGHMMYHGISANANYGIESVFLRLARTLTQRPELVFTNTHFKEPLILLDETLLDELSNWAVEE